MNTDSAAATPDELTPIFALSHEVVEQLADADPLLATGLGLPGRDDRWTDFSPDGVEARTTLARDIITQAHALTPTTEADRIAQRVLIYEMESAIALADSGVWRRDLNNIASPWQAIREVFDVMPGATASAWDHIINRLEHMDHALSGYLAALGSGVAHDMVAARRQVLAAIEQGRAAAGEQSSLRGLINRFDTDPERAANGIDRPRAEQRIRLIAAIEHAQAAYASATDWLEQDYLPAAPEADGVGRDAWIASASRFLGTQVDPIATYDWGWGEVHRLLEQRQQLAAAIDPDATVDEVMHYLNTDPSMAAPDADAFIALMQQRQSDALDQLDGTHFDVPEPIRRIEVRVAPPGGALAAHYIGPSEDFSRPGRVMYPLEGKTSFPLYEEITTAYHEGFPGHHLQVGWQVAKGDALSRFHRLAVWYPGTGEGWALYAELLMGELGFLERPEYELGLNAAQLLRACRIVIDIGCHLGLTIPASTVTAPDGAFPHAGERWSYELGLEMMTQIVHVAPPLAESEMVRYLGWPGQAISYKYGEREYLRLRERATDAPEVDLKAFHARLLDYGSIAIDLLHEFLANDPISPHRS